MEDKTMANINDNALSSASQCSLIKAWMEEGRTITQMEALNMFGCSRLASRINDLKNRGLKIKSERIQLQNGKYVARYSLDT